MVAGGPFFFGILFHRRTARFLLVVTALLATCSSAFYIQRSGLRYWSWERFTLGKIRAETGNAFVSSLIFTHASGHDRPSPAKLYEDGRLIGPNDAIHDEIRARGEGRHSFWHDTLYFSSSDNTNPISNGRKYEVEWPRYFRDRYILPLYGVTFIFICLTCLSFLKRLNAGYKSVALADSPFYGGDGGVSDRFRARSWAINATLSLVSVAFALAVLEAGVRMVSHDSAASLPAIIPNEWNQDIGWRYTPGSSFEYWGPGSEFRTKQKVNDWGFTDQPVSGDISTADLKVMILGDSFAEALQVEMEEKFGVLLERSLARRLNASVKVVTLGRSGTGQVNQYAYWRAFGSIVKPDILILLFCHNDVRDNSSTFSARYHKWDPLHPPRLYYALDKHSQDGLLEIPVDPDWSYYGATLADDPQQNFLAKWISSHSQLYQFVERRLFGAEAAQPWNLLYKGHYVDNAFLAPSLSNDPPIREGWELTRRILEKYKRETGERNTKLVLVMGGSTVSVSTASGGVGADMFDNWIAEQSRILDVPYASLPKRFAADKLKSLDVSWKSDGHWNQKGHLLAAEEMEKAILPIAEKIVSGKKSAKAPPR